MDLYRRPHLLKLSNILLRLPSIFILEMLYNSRTRQILKESNVADVLGKNPVDVINDWGLNPENVTLGAQYVGYLVAFLLHALPMSKLVELYLHIIVGLLLVASHHISSYYVTWEGSIDDPEAFVWQNSQSVQRLLTFLSIQVTISSVCGLLMGTKHIYAFAPYMLPMVARLCGMSVAYAEICHIFAEIIIIIQVSVFVLNNILVPYRLALNGLQIMQEYVELYGLVSVIFAVYNRFFIPTVYLLFWLSMFFYQLYSYIHSKSLTVFQEKWVLVLLTTIADCCVSPWSLIGLCFAVSYGAYTVFTFCKIYLQGFAFVGENDFLRQGWTEGMTLLLLALQTGLLELKKFEKVLLLSIVLFIVMSSTIQSVYELADPILLSLGASNNRNTVKHVKVLVLFLFLFTAPLYMSYMLISFFQTEIWLLIIVSSCILTSIQTLASVTIYLLFMADHRRKYSWDNLDNTVYNIHAMCHMAEFLIALFVLAYGCVESMKGDYNLVGASIIVMHSYFNVWQRGRSGWNTFLARREASKKINSLPEVNMMNLNQERDVCAICYEEMCVARITPCKHYFHTVCLRKWLYVQTTCPMCHSKLIPPEPEPSEENSHERNTSLSEQNLNETVQPSCETEGTSIIGESEESAGEFEDSNQNEEKKASLSGIDRGASDGEGEQSSTSFGPGGDN